MPVLEEPKKKSGDALALALSNMGGSIAPDVALSAYSSWPLLQAILSGSESPVGMLGWTDTANRGGLTGRPEGSISTTEPGGGWGGFDPSGLGGTYGQMSPNELSSLAGMTRGVGLANIGLTTIGAPSFGPMMGLTNLGVRATEALLGPRERGYLGYSPTVMQELADIYGYGMNAPGVSSPSFGNFGGYGYGDPSYGGMTGMGGGGGGGSDGTGGSSAGTGEGGGSGMGGGGEAMGGVHYARPGRERLSIYGEAGPETGIFIPAFMQRPGLQGNEPQVRNALMRAILSLR